MNIAALLLAVLAFTYCAPAHAAGDPCAAAPASPMPPSRGRLAVTRDIAAYIARHAEIACARLDALVRDAAPGDAALAAKARVVQGELETGVLRPLFRLYPELRGRDLTAAEAPGAAVKLGPLGPPPRPRQMGLVTARHLRWVASDADRRFLDLAKPIATASPGAKASASEAEARKQAAALAAIEDITSEIGFVAAPVYRNYPELWKLEQRELEARMPKDTRTAESDASFRKGVPPPGSVKLSAAAVAQMRAFSAAMRREPGCHVLSLAWYLAERSRGPDDATWRESGPGLSLGARSCGQVPPDVVRTIDGIRVVFGGDKDHSFAGKTVDFVDKRFVVR